VLVHGLVVCQPTMGNGEWHRIPTAAQLRNVIIFPDSASCRPLCFSAPYAPTHLFLLWPPNYYIRSPLKTSRPPFSRICYRSLSNSPSKESLLLSQLIFVAVVVYRFFLSRFRISYPPLLSELSNYLSAQSSSLSNFS